jgi:hypothetical protein
MFSPRPRVSDRTGCGLEYVGDHDTCFSAFYIHVKLDVFEKRGMDGAWHLPIDLPMGRSLVGLATVKDGSKSISLLDVRALTDDGLTLAIALVDRSGPGVQEGCAKAIQSHISKVALIYANSREAATISVGGTTWLELTRASVVAVAIAELGSFDVPVKLCHDYNTSIFITSTN